MLYCMRSHRKQSNIKYEITKSFKEAKFVNVNL